MSDSRMSRDQALMGTAQLWSQRGTCSRRKVGVVLARDGRILVTGYNGAPAGMRECEHPGRDDIGDAGCTHAIHAEANAIAYAARWGLSLQGAELWTTCMPCLSCAQLVIASGIETVYFGEYYRNTAGADLMKLAGLLLVNRSDMIEA